MLVPVAAAWAAVVKDLEGDVQVKVGVLALVTLALIVLKPGPNKQKKEAAGTPTEALVAVEKPKVRRLPYPRYDVSSAEAKKASFGKIMPMLIDEACAEVAAQYEVREAEVAWIRKMLTYNCIGGKMNRGLMVVETGVVLFEARGREVTNDDLCKFAVLGWVIEMLQAWLLVADDMMDSSLTRRGQPCWYKVDGVGPVALNDAFLIEMVMFKVVKRHFGDAPEYAALLDLLFETTLQTELGQLLDLKCDHAPLDAFTLDRWTAIVKYKTAFYSFYLPVAMGMILAGIDDRAEYDAAREILVIMGVYFQAQDDFLDAFGTPEQIGKIGTDIQDKKCGWLFVNAYHTMVDKDQKKLLDAHYGKCKVGSKEEKKIKAMYKEIGLEKLYKDYEQASYDQIMALEGTCKQVPWAVFDIFLKKIFKRSK